MRIRLFHIILTPHRKIPLPAAEKRNRRQVRRPLLILVPLTMYRLQIRKAVSVLTVIRRAVQQKMQLSKKYMMSGTVCRTGISGSLILPAVSIRKRVNTCSQKQVINISFWNMLLKIPGTKRNVSFPSLHFSALRMDLLLKPIMEERKSFPPPFLQDDMRSAISISPFLKVQRQSRWNTSLTAFPQAECAFPMRVKKIQHTDLRQIQAARRDLSGWAILLPLIFRE